MVVDEDGDTAVGVEAEEPLFLLVVGHDISLVLCQKLSSRIGEGKFTQMRCPIWCRRHLPAPRA